MPEEYGGIGQGYLTHIVAAEAISKGSGSIGLSYIADTNLAMNQIVLNGTHEQKLRLLPNMCTGQKHGALAMSEPDAGSDVMAMRMKASFQDDGGAILNGEKTWITNGGTASTIVTYAKSDTKKLTSFLVDTNNPDFKRTKKIDKMSMRASETWSLHYDDVYVPQEDILGKKDQGSKVLMTGLNYERLLLSAGALGIGQAALEYTVNYGHERQQFAKPLMQQQAYAHKVGELKAKIDMAREALYSLAKAADNGSTLSNSRASAIFIVAANTANEIVQELAPKIGGFGLTTDSPMGVYKADAWLYQVGGGAKDIQTEVMARSCGYDPQYQALNSMKIA